MTTDIKDEREVPREDCTMQTLLQYVNTRGFEGLSDTQIQRVVEYRAAVIAERITLKALSEQRKREHEELLNNQRKVAEQMQAALASALANATEFKVVNDLES